MSYPISLSHVNKHYQKQVLNNVSLTVQTGQIFGLVGLNGSGKTTIIKSILNLIEIDSGQIKIFDILADQHTARRNLIYLPEKFIPAAFMTGYEFLDLTLEHYQVSYTQAEIIALATTLQLDHGALTQKISNYSKGMGQKLGLIAVFLAKRPLLILDEPMSGLDAQARISLKKLILDYVSQGNSVLLTSHILSDIDEICDEVAIINKQTIGYQGTTKNFKQQYPGKSLEESFIKFINT